MDAVEFLKARLRMCTGRGCIDCPLYDAKEEDMDCEEFQEKYPEQAVAIVEQWAKEHPKRTYLSVLLEKFPNVEMDIGNGTPFCCPERIFGGKKWDKCDCSSDICVKCWNRECKEETN